jgi:hypothetical protein
MDPPHPRDRRHELLATILLAFAALATAWSTFQSTTLRGDQAANTAKATAARIESSEASTRAGQLTQIDIATFTEWVDADVAGDQELADFYRRRFRDEFEPAFDAWLATNPLSNAEAPLTPFEMPEYQVSEAEDAQRLSREAAAWSDAASEDNNRADDYMLAVVLFASSLFFAGMSTKLAVPRHRQVLLGLSGVISLATVAWIATLPITLIR